MSLVGLQGISVHFPVGGGLFRKAGVLRAVEDVSLEIGAGETLALVGESGSGKSTLGSVLAGLRAPTAGVVSFRDRPLDAAGWREARKQIQVVFQDPYSALDPRMPVSSIIAEPLRINRIGTARERQARAAELVGQVGLPTDALNRYPHEFSGGQRQRIAIARALAPSPELIIADEPLSALDVSIQSQVLNLMKALQAQHGLAYLFISHDLAVVHHLVDRVAVLYLGRLVEIAPREALFARPSHPYTALLLDAVPRIGRRRERGSSMIRGEMPSPLAPPPGCVFTRAAPRRRRCAGWRRRSWRRRRGGRRSWRRATSRNRRMGRFILTRSLQALLVLLVMSFVIYSLIGLMPGDPLDVMIASNPGATPEVVAHLRAIYGLDQPLVLRYWHWLLSALVGNFGYSRTYSQPVLLVLLPALWVTCKLMVISFTISVVASLLLGIVAALRPGGIVDSLISLLAFAGISVPVFWLALVLILLFAVSLHWLPASGQTTVGLGGVGDQIRHLVMPVATLALASTGNFIRYVRASMIETLRMDHVRTARAKGAGERRVVLVHAFRNALIPVVTVMALSFGTLFSGALVTETMFALPGMGKTIYDAILGNDFNLALVGLLFATFVTLVSNLAADLLYGALDPRISLQ